MSFANSLKASFPKNEWAKALVKQRAIVARMKGDSFCIIDIPSLGDLDLTLEDCKQAAENLGFHDATVRVIPGSMEPGSVWLSFSVIDQKKLTKYMTNGHSIS